MDLEKYLMIKAYFDSNEYDRAAHFAKDGETDRVQFLHYYSRYLAGEKKRLESQTDNMANLDVADQAHLRYSTVSKKSYGKMSGSRW